MMQTQYMQEIKEAMLAVFQDVVYSQLHPKVKQQFELAIKRLDFIEADNNFSAELANRKVKEINAAQKAYFINFKSPPARFLSREIDSFQKCSNE